jgi:uncharacterized membrane protein
MDQDTKRLEAFTDGVIAILVTIMVLEIHPPKAPTWAALSALWPSLLAYQQSFLYIAIYWVNHHNLIKRARHFTVGIFWTNMLLLFCLSLIPLSAAWMDSFQLQPVPTATFLATLYLPAVAYSWLHAAVHKVAHAEHLKPEALKADRIKHIVSIFLYILGILLAFGHEIMAQFCATFVALIWIVPNGRVDRFLKRLTSRSAARHT